VPTLAEDDALIVEGLHVSFAGAHAVADVSLDVRPGEVVALLGANGAGKTTTLRAISGLHRPDAGRVHYRGRDLTGRPAHEVSRAGIAHVPEGRRLFSRMTVRENLEVGLYRRWPVKDTDLDRAFDLFPELAKLQRHQAYSLSGGEQQMVTIARALLPDPDIVMLDEPSLGLAPVIVDRIIDTILRLRDEGKGVLLVEQDTSVALLCSDRGHVLANGTVVFSGTRDELKGSERVTEAYIGR
jgi:branched-chain amino acid transport system ATP-binding protein